MTSAMPTGLRLSVPLKMTSAISSPRSALAEVSPSTQRMASTTFDLPQPFGPDDAGDAGVELKVGLVREGFEAVDFESLEIHQREK